MAIAIRCSCGVKVFKSTMIEGRCVACCSTLPEDEDDTPSSRSDESTARATIQQDEEGGWRTQRQSAYKNGKPSK
jgi:hypothetical protein